ncbi:MAG: hypothetical protein J0M33_23790 [Anaerolineae bacterium]|nr:hypothetical protein [Anaerolineae bacterium]
MRVFLLRTMRRTDKDVLKIMKRFNWHISQQLIAESLRYHRNTVSASIIRLQRLGCLSPIDPGRGWGRNHARQYQFHPEVVTPDVLRWIDD